MFDEQQIDLVDILDKENSYPESPLLKVKGRDLGEAIITTEAMKMGYTSTSHGNYIYEIKSGDKRIPFYNNSPANSYVYSHCAKRKNIAKKMLARSGVPIPEGEVFSNFDQAIKYFEVLDDEVAIKPSNSFMALGVTTGISTKDEFIKGWDFAKSHNEEVIVERSIDGYDLRVWVIGGKAVAAYIRFPANVIGDGTSTIKQLVEIKNRRRKLNPNLIRDPIDRFDLLDRQGISLDDIPAKGKRVWLASVATAGGDIVPFINHVDKKVLRIAEKAACTFPGLTQVGVDLIVRTGKSNGEAVVLEVNSNPDISSPTFPGYGVPFNTPHLLIKHVFNRQPIRPEGNDNFFDPAPLCCYTISNQSSTRKMTTASNLIRQACYRRAIEVEDLASNIFAVANKKKSYMFVRGIPESTNVVSRMICNDQKIFSKFLKSENIPYSKEININQNVNFYRLFIINNKVVSGLLSVTSKNRLGFDINHKWEEITESVNSQFCRVICNLTTKLFSPYIAGVNLLAEDISKSPDNQVWAINYATCRPDFAWHHYPDVGIGRDVAGYLLDSIFGVG